MPFQEDFTEFLDIEQGFDIEAKVTPINGGLSYKIRGIFNNDYYGAEICSSGFAGSNPEFECSEDEASEIEYCDLIKINKLRYRVALVKPDGCGRMILSLERLD